MLPVQVAPVRVQDLREIFDILDSDGNGEIDLAEFMEGFRWVHAPLTGKS